MQTQGELRVSALRLCKVQLETALDVVQDRSLLANNQARVEAAKHSAHAKVARREFVSAVSFRLVR